MIGRIANKVLGAFGYQMRRKPVSEPRESAMPRGGYDIEDEARAAIERVKDHTMVSYERLVVLYQQVVHCECAGVPGCYVECGTWRGGSVGMMALANLDHSQERRHLHLFDSFEGIPEPMEDLDGQAASDWARKHGAGADGRLVAIRDAYEAVGSLDANKELIEGRLAYPAEFVHYHVGWFQDAVPQAASQVGDIAILRLDGDWYESTQVCLQNLYDLVVSGGFVIIDDYGHYEGCRRAVEDFLAERGLKVFLNHIDYTGRYWIKD